MKLRLQIRDNNLCTAIIRVSCMRIGHVNIAVYNRFCFHDQISAVAREWFVFANLCARVCLLRIYEERLRVLDLGSRSGWSELVEFHRHRDAYQQATSVLFTLTDTARTLYREGTSTLKILRGGCSLYKLADPTEDFVYCICYIDNG